MEDIILKAMTRSEKLNKVRKAGFIPGVINNSGAPSTSVQFENVELNKIISKHGSNARLWILLGDEKKFGFIKEVQYNPTSGKVIHVAIQLVKSGQESKLIVPIIFNGIGLLETKVLELHTSKTEVELEGRIEFIPETIVVDVSNKQVGEDVTSKDFNLPTEIKILDAEDEIYATVKPMKQVEEESDEDSSAE